jgi:hypothetical protein
VASDVDLNDELQNIGRFFGRVFWSGRAKEKWFLPFAGIEKERLKKMYFGVCIMHFGLFEVCQLFFLQKKAVFQFRMKTFAIV